MYKLICILILLCFISCTSIKVEEGNFLNIYNNLKKENKYMCMLIGGGKECNPCNIAIREIKKCDKSHVILDSFIFYKCDVTDSNNQFINYIFLTENIPNLYIFNPHGELISYYAGKLDHAEILEYLNAVLIRKTIVKFKHQQFNAENSQLLKMQNILLQANLQYIKANNDSLKLKYALKLVQHSINIEPYFYNLYLKSKLLNNLSNYRFSESCSRKALKYCRGGFQRLVFDSLVEDLKKMNNVDSLFNKTKMKFDIYEKDCGKIKYGSETKFEFNFENISHFPLVIRNISSTCGCIVPIWEKEPIEAGEKGKIIVNFKAVHKGKFNRTIFVQSNIGDSIIKLKLKGYVV